MAIDGKILVIRGGAIGDFILTLPVYAALRSRFPGIPLETVAYPAVAELAFKSGLVDAVRPIESGPLAGFFANQNPSLDKGWSDYFSKFSVIFSYLFDPDGIFKANVESCTKAQFIIGPHRPEEHEGTHATSVFLKPLEQLAVFDADPSPCLILPNISVPAFEGKAWTAIHLGSGSESKNWPIENWIELSLQILADSTNNVLIIGGEAEGEKLDRVSIALDSTRIRVARSLPLIELAGLISHCDSFVGHDSGITHLAAALGLRGVVIWGPSRHDVWKPHSSDFDAVHAGAGGLQGLAVDAVWERVKLLM